MSNQLINRETYDPAAVAEYVCDTLCRHRHNIDLTQDDLEEICEKCNMESLLGIPGEKTKEPEAVDPTMDYGNMWISRILERFTEVH